MNNRTDGTAETTDMMDYIHPDNFGIWLRCTPREPNLKNPCYVPFCFIAEGSSKLQENKCR